MSTIQTDQSKIADINRHTTECVQVNYTVCTPNKSRTKRSKYTMKQIVKMSRLAGELEKAFRLLNCDLFDNALQMPIITVIPSSKSYAHYTTYDAWNTSDGAKREINIASGTLDRPLENIISSLLHEMVHMYNDIILNISDTSRGGTYHNKQFKREAEAHGLLVTRSDKYGWSHTQPSDTLIEWILDHEELRDIEMCRVSPTVTPIAIGTHSNNGGELTPIKVGTNSHHRKYICPCCGTVIRATKKVNVLCADCCEPFVEA